jgi:hypothetical protein
VRTGRDPGIDETNDEGRTGGRRGGLDERPCKRHWRYVGEAALGVDGDGLFAFIDDTRGAHHSDDR